VSALDHLTGATIGSAPEPCRACMWWQTRPGREPAEKRRFIDHVEDEFGPWGQLYHQNGEMLGLIQYGPATAFPRAAGMPAGPPTRDAVIVTCAYLVSATTPWVLQSLVLAAIGDCRDRGCAALEAFGYRYAQGESFPTRFLRHRTIFPIDFLADFGFAAHRSAGRISLMRLDLRTTIPVPEESRVERLKSKLAVLSPAPAPVR
jgi:hypothetical protein